MNPGLASSAVAKTKSAATPAPRRRRLLWVISALLGLLLAGILTLAFTLGGDDSTPAVTAAAPAAVAVPLPAAASAADTADSGEIVVDHLPGPRPREISGEPVDADGNSLNPNLVGPGDDSPYQKDDNKDDDNKDN